MYCCRCRRCAFWFRLYCHFFVRSSGSSIVLLSQNGTRSQYRELSRLQYSSTCHEVRDLYVICTGGQEQEHKRTGEENHGIFGLSGIGLAGAHEKNKVAKPTFIINLNNRGTVFFLLLAASRRSIREFFLVVLASTTCSSRHSSQELPN